MRPQPLARGPIAEVADRPVPSASVAGPVAVASVAALSLAVAATWLRLRRDQEPLAARTRERLAARPAPSAAAIAVAPR